jgi:uncharacterized membrane protein
MVMMGETMMPLLVPTLMSARVARTTMMVGMMMPFLVPTSMSARVARTKIFHCHEGILCVFFF